MKSKLAELKKEFVAAVVLYRLADCEEEIPVETSGSDYEEFAQEVELLKKIGAIASDADNEYWEPTESGLALLDKIFEVCDSLADLDIFSGVNLSLETPDELFDEEGRVAGTTLDPRFEEPADEAEAELFGTTDLRVPILDYMLETCRKKSQLPYTPEHRQEAMIRAIFLLELGGEKYTSEEEFFDLKIEDVAFEIADFVSSVPPWIELAREYSPPQGLMEMIIGAGLYDAQKRNLLDEVSGSGFSDENKRCELVSKLLNPIVPIL